MHVLLIKLGFIHQKNLSGFRAMCDHVGAELIEITSLTDDAKHETWDLVWIPIGFVHPGTIFDARRIILGPHNFVFPPQLWIGANLADSRAAYNCLSPWNRDVYSKLGGVGGLDLVCLPYPVDTKRFKPSSLMTKRYDCFLYVKLRKTEDVKYAMKTLDQLGLTYKTIHYNSYEEEDYIEALDTCNFGVWVGRHESQGFALQEALSCNVPLIVWDVDCMGEEWMQGDKVYTGAQGALKATTAPFWDARCGILVQQENLKEGVRFMKSNWPIYRPRDFVLDNLGVDACARRWGMTA